MNDIKNINLGGFPFAIDMEAYHALEDYLDTITDHFAHSKGSAEIVSDIEARIAEIFRDRPSNLDIVVLKDVHNAISIMGTPEDFGATSAFESEDYDDIPESEWAFGRKLMRDPEDKIVSGVCSGIAAYLGFEDPIWGRVAMAILVFGMGFSIMVSIILIFVMPEANTASDRLAMRGEAVNIENIGKEMERGFESLSDSMNRFGEKMNEFGEKMAGRK